MSFKTAVQARWNNVYQWLQETDHMDTHPEGPVFVFLERHELQDILGEKQIRKLERSEFASKCSGPLGAAAVGFYGTE